MIDTNIIISKFYDFHEKPNDIAKELEVSPSYITKIIKKDDRYPSEKAYRQELSKENRKVSKREWIKNKRKSEADKQLIKVQFVKEFYNKRQKKGWS